MLTWPTLELDMEIFQWKKKLEAALMALLSIICL